MGGRMGCWFNVHDARLAVYGLLPAAELDNLRWV